MKHTYAFLGDFTFKITGKSQFSQLNWLITVNLALAIIFYYFFGFSLWGPLPYVYLGFILVDILPTLFVHIQYYQANKHAKLDIDTSLHRIRYVTAKKTLTYNFDDIESFVRMDSWRIGVWYSFADYSYYKITFTDKKEIIVTSLMIENIKYVLEPLLNRLADKKRRPIAFIKRS
jgi:hypothetical protein